MFKLLLCTVLAYYIWTTTAGTGIFDFARKDYGSYISYNHLTDAFISRKLNLLVEPNQELLNLGDPYDPVLNAPYRFHDATLYMGKHYFYWGAVPAILLYVPYHLITGCYLPDNIAVLIFMFTGLIWSTLLLFYLKEIYFQEIPKWVLATTVAVLGFADLGGFMVREPGVYQVSISSGFSFLSGSVYFLCLGLSNTKNSLLKLLVGSLFLGLSIGCRANLAIGAFVIILICILKLKLRAQENFKNLFKDYRLFILIIPFALCLLSLAISNYLRFHSFFEFGFKYQTGLYNYNKTNYFNLQYIPSNIYFFIFQPPIINSIFPYVHMAPSQPIFIRPAQLQFMLEPIIGVIPLVPFILLIFLAPSIYFVDVFDKKKSIVQQKKFPLFEFSLVLLPAVINIAVLVSGGAATLRYVVDFIALLIIVSSISWFYFDNSLTNKLKSKLIVRFIAILFAVYSVFVGIILGFTGAGNRFIYQNPDLYYRIENLFKPISEFVLRIIPSDEGYWEKINNELKKVSIPVSIIPSSTHSDAYNVSNVIDSNLRTDWVAKNSNPTTLIVIPEHPAVIKSIWLLARKHRLLECWKKVEAKFYLRGEPVSSQIFTLTNAHKKRLQHIEFHPVITDKIELFFSEPVTINLVGGNEDPGALCPGYTEIMFEWFDPAKTINKVSSS